MNHQKIYDAIIAKAKSENRIKLKKTDVNYVYYERHHIYPKCLSKEFGLPSYLNNINDSINLVLTTAREHYVLHKLLTYIYKGNRGIALAFHKITYSKNGDHIKSSRDYAYARELMSKTPVSMKSIEKRKITLKNNNTKERKQKHSDSLKGEKNPFFGKHHTEKSKQKMKKPKSEEHKRKIGKTQKGKYDGEKNPMFGKTFYDIWLIKYGKEIADLKLLGFKEKQKCKIPWNKGKTDVYSDETLKKQSEIKKGKKATKKTKIKMRNSAKNRKKIICPYCNREIDCTNFSKWHGDKCKFK